MVYNFSKLYHMLHNILYINILVYFFFNLFYKKIKNIFIKYIIALYSFILKNKCFYLCITKIIKLFYCIIIFFIFNIKTLKNY